MAPDRDYSLALTYCMHLVTFTCTPWAAKIMDVGFVKLSALNRRDKLQSWKAYDTAFTTRHTKTSLLLEMPAPQKASGMLVTTP